MLLYKFLFPQKDICEENEMYFRGKGFSIQNDTLVFEQNGEMLSSTYFNSISLDKWYNNTIAENISIKLTLKGQFLIQLGTYKTESIGVIQKMENEVSFSSEKKEEIEIQFNNESGIGFVRVLALSENATLFSGEYLASAAPDSIRDIKIAVGICTFQREEFITANLKRLIAAVEDEDSVLYHNLDVYVADNGQTLPETLNTDHIKMVYNPNYGGASGFTRTLIEAKKSGKPYTHFIFLDDDIVLDTHAIEKNALFLRALKKEKFDSVIGGAMFSTDDRYLQFESAAKWQNTGFKFNRRDVDLRLIENVVLNEKEYDVNYNAWCYCCIPFSLAKDNNLPLPVFFHMDDVEYGLRNALPVITLNGINVWHLYKKKIVPAKNIYYDTRNKIIMLSELNPKAAVQLAYSYYSGFTTEILKFHYAKAINAFEGILDFCKGFDWFKKTNTLSIHKKLFNNVAWTDSSPEVIEKAVFSKQSARNRKVKISVLKDQLLPHQKTKVVFDDNDMEDTKGCKTVIVVSEKDNKQIIYKKSYRLLMKCLLMKLRVAYALKKELPRAIEEYNLRIPEVQALSFWNQYLELPVQKAPHKILFVASDNDSTSGAFRSMTVLCRLMKELYNLEVKVLLPRVGDGMNLLKENDIEYTIIPSEDWIVKMSDNKAQINKKKKKIKEVNSVALKKIQKYLQEENFDLVHINTTYHYVAALAANNLGIPVVWHLREFLEEDQQRRIIDKDFGYRLINKATKIVTISDSIYDKYKTIFDADKLVRIYNGIDPKPFYTDSHEVLTGEVPNFVCVGVIDAYKGQGELVEACGKFKEKYHKPFTLTLIGNNSGEYMSTIHSLISKYSLDQNVVIAGRRSDVNEQLKNTDITFVCSKAEAFGRVTIEAMMAGSFVIGANSAGTKELIRDKTDGLLYTPENSSELCEKIHYALTHIAEVKKMTKKGNKKALSEFSAQTNCKNIYELYQSIWGVNNK